MKIKHAALLMSLITLGSMSASAQTTYSGAALESLDYSSAYSGDAQSANVGGTEVAQLATADLSTSGDSPAVFVPGPLGTLSSFIASYDLLSAGTTVDPYWILYLAPDTSFLSPIITTDDASTINGSSLVHVGDLTSGSITLSELAAMTYSPGETYGEQTVEYAGLEIGDGGSGSGTANIESITIGAASVPDAASTMALLGIGFGALACLRRRFNRA